MRFGLDQILGGALRSTFCAGVLLASRDLLGGVHVRARERAEGLPFLPAHGEPYLLGLRRPRGPEHLL